MKTLDPPVLAAIAAASRVVAHADARVQMLNLRPHLDELAAALVPVLLAHGRVCPSCGAGFLPARPHQVHCSYDCREAIKTLAKRARRADARVRAGRAPMRSRTPG